MFKNITISPLIILVVGATSFLGLPWWMTAVGGIIAGVLYPAASGKAFLVGFATGFSLWWGCAFFFNFANNSMLAAKVGELFQGLQSWQLLAGTGILGGILAGLGLLSGSLGRQLLNASPNAAG